jgi:DNA polymerase III epsilon subunit-like protein
MDFFLDFEASQFTQEIISIGCVSETDEQFYSLVNTKHRIGTFVKGLTGLTQEEIKNAPTPDVVFYNFFLWLYKTADGGKVNFICYGNNDTNFAIKTLQNVKDAFFAQCALSVISTNTIDYADYVKTYFGLSQNIGLLKIAQFFSPDKELVQTHNALDDALMLKFVYDNIQNGLDIQDDAVLDYMTKIERYTSTGELLETYFGLGKAVDWVMEFQGMPKDAKKKKVANHIKLAAEEDTGYCGFKWKIIHY